MIIINKKKVVVINHKKKILTTTMMPFGASVASIVVMVSFLHIFTPLLHNKSFCLHLIIPIGSLDSQQYVSNVLYSLSRWHLWHENVPIGPRTCHTTSRFANFIGSKFGILYIKYKKQFLRNNIIPISTFLFYFNLFINNLLLLT